VCGGSSSCAAASVALGICAVGIGTDTSGSVRVQAAFTGLFGWKPARGSWPMGGVRGLAPSLDALGVIANTIEDVALVHMALRKAAEPPVGSRQLRVIVADEPLFAASDPAPRENALVALRLLEQQGLRVEMRSIPEFRAVAETFRACGTLVAAEAWRRYRHLLGRPEAARIDPLVRSRLEAAGGLSRAHYRSLTRAQEQLSQALRARGRPVAYAVPTTPNTAPLLSEVQEPEGHARVNARTLQHTMLGSFLDLPGLSVPSGADASGLPTGLLLSALPEDQEVLLELGRSLGSDLIRGGS
jgi:aspartyl-tRNA(Asn)/glutamyl-tRNA(Gln) amidotransferase subunit A